MRDEELEEVYVHTESLVKLCCHYSLHLGKHTGNSGRAEVIDPASGQSRVIRIECRLMKARCLFTLDGQFVASFKRGDRWYKEAVRQRTCFDLEPQLTTTGAVRSDNRPGCGCLARNATCQLLRVDLL